MSKISTNALKVLADNCTVSGTAVIINVALDRKLYAEVNSVLESLGGKWNRKQKAHVFDEDPTDALASVILSGEFVSLRDFRKQSQFFPTPENIVRKMLELAKIGPEHTVLEPSAGDGAIAKLIPNSRRVYCVEILPDLCEKLRDIGMPHVICEDFLKFAPISGKVDRIVMNPPFRNQQDIDHVTAAFGILKPCGILVSIVSESCFFRDNQKARDFRDLYDMYGTSDILPAGSFRESGTMVSTRIITLAK